MLTELPIEMAPSLRFGLLIGRTTSLPLAIYLFLVREADLISEFYALNLSTPRALRSFEEARYPEL